MLVASGCDVGTMDVNFRGRLAGCADADAGNYEDKIPYLPADYASPALVRKSIASKELLQRAASPPTTLPTSASDFSRVGMISFVTNWGFPFFDSIVLASCGSKAELHLPIMDCAPVPARIAHTPATRP